jgi:hypothetical protein
LRALKRGGPVVCVPGFHNKVMVQALRFLPRSLLRRATELRKREM